MTKTAAKTSNHDKLRALLATHPLRENKCETCSCGKSMTEDIITFKDMRASGETSASWSWFHRHCLKPAGYAYSYSTFMNHVRNCLNVKERK